MAAKVLKSYAEPNTDIYAEESHHTLSSNFRVNAR